MSVCFILCGLSSKTYAQTLLGFAGEDRVSLGNGDRTNAALFGFAFNFTVGGSSTRQVGFEVPLGMEFDVDTKGYFDIQGNVDAGIRVGPVSFGPGVTFDATIRPDAVDPTCTQGNVISGGSCDEPGKRLFPNAYMLGISGFGKYSFAGRRAFIQARYIYFPSALYWYTNPQASLGVFSTSSNGNVISQTADIPAFNHGSDLRLSAGYIFRNKTIIRFQVRDRKLDYVSELGNLTGIYNIRYLQITGAVGFAF